VKSVKCYSHAKAGSSEDAVAICIVCGMGVCMEHAVMKDMPAQKYPGLSGKPSEREMVILCEGDARRFSASG
jgi:hypothetical protein